MTIAAWVLVLVVVSSNGGGVHIESVPMKAETDCAVARDRWMEANNELNGWQSGRAQCVRTGFGS